MSEAPVTTNELNPYAMHLLDADESSRIESFLLHSPEAREELQLILGDLACLAFSAEPHAVPEDARGRFMSSIGRASKAPMAAPVFASQPAIAAIASTAAEAPTAAPRLGKIYDDQAERSFFARLVPWAGWAVAAGLAISTWAFYQRSTAMQGQVAEAQSDAAHAAEISEKAVADAARAKTVLDTLGSRSAQRFLLTRQNTAPVPSARVTYVASTGSLVFQGNNLESVPSEKTYELWLIPADKTAKPIPAGTFRPDARGFASLILPTLPKGVTAATFGITMEDVGGSQSPTLPILLIGA